MILRTQSGKTTVEVKLFGGEEGVIIDTFCTNWIDELYTELNNNP